MDVSTVSVAQSNAVSAYQAGAAKRTANAGNAGSVGNGASLEEKIGDAYSVKISDAAKQAKQAEQADGKSESKTKGLSASDIEALQADVQEKSLQFMIDLLSANNDKLQGYLDEGIGKLRLGGVEIDASRFAMPAVATTPEEAEAALAEGGDWSVGAVSDRIFGLASALAGDDPERLEQMRAAVEKGFEQAGVAFKDYFGVKDMPQITKDTHAEIMKRFDDRTNELAGAAATAKE